MLFRSNLGVSLEEIRREVLRLLGQDGQTGFPPAGEMAGGDGRFTDRARKVMQLANQEAQRFNHEYVGTEHVLLALVREGSAVPTDILANLDRLTAIDPLTRYRHRAFNRLWSFRARAGEPLADRQIALSELAGQLRSLCDDIRASGIGAAELATLQQLLNDLAQVLGRHPLDEAEVCKVWSQAETALQALCDEPQRREEALS